MSDSTYSDDDLVYVDPDSRTVVGKVEWNEQGSPKSMPYVKKEGEKSWRKFYPWGTYRSMKGAFRINGKRVEEESESTLDSVLPKFLKDLL